MEGVDERVRVVGGAQQEVARHPDAVEAQSQPAADLHGQHRERDRDAPPAVEDVVEERVAGVVVALRLAGEAHVDEQVLPPAGQRRLRAAGGQVVEAAQLTGDVEVGVGVGGDEQGGLVEGQLVLRALHQLREPRGRTHDPTVPPLPAFAGPFLA